MKRSGKLGSIPRISVPSAPPRPARPEPTAKVTANTVPTGMPRPRATRASSTAARRRLPKRVRSRASCRPSASAPQITMMKDAVEADLHAQQLDPAVSHGGSFTFCWLDPIAQSTPRPP